MYCLRNCKITAVSQRAKVVLWDAAPLHGAVGTPSLMEMK